MIGSIGYAGPCWAPRLLSADATRNSASTAGGFNHVRTSQYERTVGKTSEVPTCNI